VNVRTSSPAENAPPASLVAAALGSLGALAVASALVPVRDEFGSANVAVVLGLVTAAASVEGQLAGALTALVAAMSFNFLHTRPYLSLRVHAARDVITVGLLLIVGVVAGWFFQRLADARLRSEHRRADTAVLERVAALVANDAPPTAVWEAIRSGLTEELLLADCRFEAGPERGRIVIGRNGRILSPQLEFVGGGFSLPVEGAEIPVMFAGGRLGAIVVKPRPRTGTQREERRVAVALADLLATSMARHPGAADLATPPGGDARG
jgi:Domain of unknown function (DUF4118)